MKQKVKKLTAVRRLTLVNLSQSVKLYGGNAVPSAEQNCTITVVTITGIADSANRQCNTSTIVPATGIAVDSMPEVCNTTSNTY
jgi:hypothetical protein